VLPDWMVDFYLVRALVYTLEERCGVLFSRGDRGCINLLGRVGSGAGMLRWVNGDKDAVKISWVYAPL
jgi:hypothetical protein